MSPGRLSARGTVTLIAVVAVLAGITTVAIAAASGAFRSAWTAPGGACRAPSDLPGAVVDATVTNMGPSMMTGGMTRVVLDRSEVPAGQVSLRVVNTGSLVHELVVLPLPAGQQVGERPVGPDNKVDETGSLGEASNTCGAGTGDGIDPGAVSWVTLRLPAGTYELICNLAGPYAADMYAELTAT